MLPTIRMVLEEDEPLEFFVTAYGEIGRGEEDAELYRGAGYES